MFVRGAIESVGFFCDNERLCELFKRYIYIWHGEGVKRLSATLRELSRCVLY